MKHEYWMYYIGDVEYGPIDKGKPVTASQIKRYIRKRHETTEDVRVMPYTPWWEMSNDTHSVTEISTAIWRDIK